MIISWTLIQPSDSLQHQDIPLIQRNVTIICTLISIWLKRCRCCKQNTFAPERSMQVYIKDHTCTLCSKTRMSGNVRVKMWEPGYGAKASVQKSTILHWIHSWEVREHDCTMSRFYVHCTCNWNSGRSPILLPSDLLLSTLLLNEILVHQQGQQCSVRTLHARACSTLLQHTSVYLTKVSGQVNPHVNWLLEKLGFKHARTTLPKSIQRGAMDPLDMVVASVLELLVKLTATKKLQMSTTSPATID